ncbi:hypothetical protein ACJ72_02528 [Emergomyces africanus]|uniref:Uncharacterized protein n=1 Tax=Emergomyces africanus TaxID=1955775 RepID=A0A1B7P257_9EURO|nr:hypothetical protein ACJ72_02528 [Emergomyces africanus]
MQDEGQFDMSTSPTPLPHLQNNNPGAMMRGSLLVASTMTTTIEAPPPSATESPTAININNSFADSAIDMDTSSGAIAQTPDTTTTTATATTTKTKPPTQKSTTATITIITERLLRLARLMANSNSNADHINNNTNKNNNNNNNNNNSNSNSSDNKRNDSPTYPHASSLPLPLSLPLSSLSRQKSIAINRYIDSIEDLLLDPHDAEGGVDGGEGEENGGEEESEEGINKSTASSSLGGEEEYAITNHTIAASSSSSSPSLSDHHLPPPSPVSKPKPGIEFQNGWSQSPRRTQKYRPNQVDHNELDILVRDLQLITRSLEQRRSECLHLNSVFIVKCEKLAQRILEMEDEIDELRVEKIENTIELEGLKGTVRGLEGWIRRWKMKKEMQRREAQNGDVHSEYTWSSSSSSSAYSSSNRGRGEWDNNRNQGTLIGVVDNAREEEDIDTLMDGISEWLGGWHEVEEGFRIRARLRKRRGAMRFSLNRAAEPLIN